VGIKENNMPIDLSNHKWPVRDIELRSKPESGELTHSAYKTFVSEGALYVRTIDFNGQMRAIPRESSMITAMGYDDHMVYGATKGEQSWLFQYALLSFREAAIPFCPIPDCTETTAIIVMGHEAYAAANNATEGRIIKITGLGLPGDVIQEWGIPRAQFKDIVVPVPGERIAKMIRSSSGDFYGLAAPSGTIFRFDPESGESDIIAPVNPIRFFGSVLVEDKEGSIYTFGAVGKMMRYTPYNNKFEATSVKVPCFPGRGPYAKISAAVYDPSQNRIYVGDTEGLLNAICLDDESIITLGKPVPLGGIDHLIRIKDGRIYGVAGGLDGMSHLFVYDPRVGSLRDLGVCCATVEKGWYGYNFGAMLSTPDGRIVLGENDHMGCLFSYYPP
jgi:hypothetical protein